MSKLSQYKGDEIKKNEEDDAQKELKNKFNTYKNMSKEQLNVQLMQEVARQKSSGSFDYQTLSNMVENLKGALPEKDYQNVKRILESLK